MVSTLKSAGTLSAPGSVDQTENDGSLAELIAEQLEGTEEIACCAIAVRVSQLMSVVVSSHDDEGVGVRDLHFQLYNSRKRGLKSLLTEELQGGYSRSL